MHAKKLLTLALIGAMGITSVITPVTSYAAEGVVASTEEDTSFEEDDTYEYPELEHYDYEVNVGDTVTNKVNIWFCDPDVDEDVIVTDHNYTFEWYRIAKDGTKTLLSSTDTVSIASVTEEDFDCSFRCVVYKDGQSWSYCNFYISDANATEEVEESYDYARIEKKTITAKVGEPIANTAILYHYDGEQDLNTVIDDKEYINNTFEFEWFKIVDDVYTKIGDTQTIQISGTDTVKGTETYCCYIYYKGNPDAMSRVEFTVERTEESGTTDPTDPDVTDPTDPDVTDPSTPDVTDPSKPDVTDPSKPEGTDPSTPDVTDPSKPEVTDPSTPDVTDPSKPEDKPNTEKPEDKPNTEKPTAHTHNYGEWVVKTNATVLEEGMMERTCACGAKETESIAKLPATISLNYKSIPLTVKQSTTAVKVKYGKGDGIKSWKSSNTKVATVNKSGKITGKKAGTAKITVTLKSGKKATVTVKVQKNDVKTSKISVNSKSVKLKKGKTFQIKATVSPVTSKQKITYTSSNKKVATVNAKGKITGKKKGTATIKVSSGKKTAKIKVTVK